MRLPPEVSEALDGLTVPWVLKPGSRHVKIMVNGQIAGVLPHGRLKEATRRATLNLVSQIRRVAATGGAARRG